MDNIVMNIERRLDRIEDSIEVLMNAINGLSEWWVISKRSSFCHGIYLSMEEAEEFIESSKISTGKRFAKNSQLGREDIFDIAIVVKPRGTKDLEDKFYLFD